MLNQASHWMELVATAADTLLLFRVLTLRLQRTYLFITLAVLLSVLFDGVSIWLGASSREAGLVFVYSQFLWVFVRPAAAYDVWEEAPPPIARIRRFGAIRLAISLVIAAIFGLIIVGFAGSASSSESEEVFSTFAAILWAASSTASLAFLWSVGRVANAQGISLPRNTQVWLQFYRLNFGLEVLSCFLLITNAGYTPELASGIYVVLNLFSTAVAAWCIWKLRPVPLDTVTPSQDAGTL